MTTTARTAVHRPITAQHEPGSSHVLHVLRTVLERLELDGIRYCHWKSNEHLGESMSGSADLDILVARDASIAFARVMAEHDFRRFAAAPGRAYPGVEDYLGLDTVTGTLVHLHVHYELTLGEKYLKGYRIPWERELLERREFDAEHGIWRTDAASELIVLLVRAVLKARWRDRLRPSRRSMPDYMDRELRWLVERVEADELVALTRRLLGDEAAAVVPGVLADPVVGLPRFRSTIARQLRSWRTYSGVGALGRRWYRELLVRFGTLQRRIGAGVTPRRRVMPRGGAFIAFVGPDGSGKSTLAREIEHWLGWKLDVLRLYGGSGADAARLPRRIMRRARARSRRQGTRKYGHEAAAPATRLTLARVAWIIALARERMLFARNARRARNRGMVVLSDRLPQTQFEGINDGPRLGSHRLDGSAIRRAAARYELQSFQAVENSPPDLVVRLGLSFDVARSRKPDTPKEQLLRKVELVPRLTWPDGTRVVEIDASQPLDEVLKAVKIAVWEVL